MAKNLKGISAFFLKLIITVNYSIVKHFYGVKDGTIKIIITLLRQIKEGWGKIPTPL